MKVGIVVGKFKSFSEETPCDGELGLAYAPSWGNPQVFEWDGAKGRLYLLSVINMQLFIQPPMEGWWAKIRFGSSDGTDGT